MNKMAKEKEILHVGKLRAKTLISDGYGVIYSIIPQSEVVTCD